MVEYMVSKMMGDYRRFFTSFKKLSLEFLVFKESFPTRMEAISFINLIIMKSNLKGNHFIYDELIKNIKRYHLVQQELMIIKNSIKGPKINSVFLFISIILSNKNADLLIILVLNLFTIKGN